MQELQEEINKKALLFLVQILILVTKLKGINMKYLAFILVLSTAASLTGGEGNPLSRFRQKHAVKKHKKVSKSKKRSFKMQVLLLLWRERHDD